MASSVQIGDFLSAEPQAKTFVFCDYFFVSIAKSKDLVTFQIYQNSRFSIPIGRGIHPALRIAYPAQGIRAHPALRDPEQCQEEDRIARSTGTSRRYRGRGRERTYAARDMPRVQKGEVLRSDDLRQSGAAEKLARDIGKTKFFFPRHNGATAVRGGLCPKTAIFGKKGVRSQNNGPLSGKRCRKMIGDRAMEELYERHPPLGRPVPSIPIP
jgi:hypothetical protein